MFAQLLVFVVALGGLLLAARYFTHAAEQIGLFFKLPAFIIGIFIIGVGTSLPELISGIIAVSQKVSEVLPGNIIGANISAIRRGNAEMAIGNVLGSCIFNTLIIPAVASWFGAIVVPQTLLTFSLPVMLCSGLFFYLLTQDKRISRWEGIIFVLIYGLFLLKIANVA